MWVATHGWGGWRGDGWPARLRRAVTDRESAVEAAQREARHRLRNALQLVVSLLALQGAYARGEEERRALERASGRVLSVVAAQETAEDAAAGGVDVESLLTRLSEGLRIPPEATDFV